MYYKLPTNPPGTTVLIHKVGVKTLCFQQPLRKALDTAGRIGADGIELDLRTELPLAECSQSAIRQIRKLLEDRRLGVAATAFPTRRGLADPNDLEGRLAALQQAMQVAAQLGSQTLLTPLGPLPAFDDDETSDKNNEVRDRLLDSLTALAREGERTGVWLTLNIGGTDAKSIDALLDSLLKETLRVSFHPGDQLAAGHDLEATIDVLGPAIQYLHAVDTVRDLGQRKTIEVELGRGSVDFPNVLAQLEAYRFQGWATVSRTEGDNVLGDLENAVAYLNQVGR